MPNAPLHQLIVVFFFFHVFAKMLTCVNPAVSFRMKANITQKAHEQCGGCAHIMAAATNEFGGTPSEGQGA